MSPVGDQSEINACSKQDFLAACQVILITGDQFGLHDLRTAEHLKGYELSSFRQADEIQEVRAALHRRVIVLHDNIARLKPSHCRGRRRGDCVDQGSGALGQP